MSCFIRGSLIRDALGEGLSIGTTTIPSVWGAKILEREKLLIFKFMLDTDTESIP